MYFTYQYLIFMNLTHKAHAFFPSETQKIKKKKIILIINNYVDD